MLAEDLEEQFDVHHDNSDTVRDPQEDPDERVEDRGEHAQTEEEHRRDILEVDGEHQEELKAEEQDDKNYVLEPVDEIGVALVDLLREVLTREGSEDAREVEHYQGCWVDDQFFVGGVFESHLVTLAVEVELHFVREGTHFKRDCISGGENSNQIVEEDNISHEDVQHNQDHVCLLINLHVSITVSRQERIEKSDITLRELPISSRIYILIQGRKHSRHHKQVPASQEDESQSVTNHTHQG